MKYTEEQLKRALVQALPDYLGLTFHDIPVWLDGNQETVTDREWPTIVGMVENSLNETEMFQYQEKRKLRSYDGKGMWHLSSILRHSWQQRARILADIGAIKVEEPK